MTYSFQVKKTTEDGQPKVEVVVSEGMAQHIPDGLFDIGGHEDVRSVGIWIRRYGEAGGFGAQAMASTTIPETKKEG